METAIRSEWEAARRRSSRFRRVTAGATATPISAAWSRQLDHAVQRRFSIPAAQAVCEWRIQPPAARLYPLAHRACCCIIVLLRDLAMVQLLLSTAPGNSRRAVRAACILLLLLTPAWAASKKDKDKANEPRPPDLLLEGGRKLTFERSFHSEREVKPKRGFWNRVVDVVAGEPEFHALIRPYSVATDSRGRIIVTDPGQAGVHIFDFAEQKYKFLWRADKGKDPMLQPQCVAVDAQDNIYVTDSDSGKIFVFNSDGKFQHAIGSLKGGEGYYKRPTGIAVDSAAQRIYVTDTLRNKIFMLDMQGNVLEQ